MNGLQEGVYQWLAINYVLGKFKYIHRETEDGSGHRHHEVVHRPRTVGAIDMGGASMQFAMEVTKDISVRSVEQTYSRLTSAENQPNKASFDHRVVKTSFSVIQY